MALFRKGERPVGRARGVPNRRTVEVRSVIEHAARTIGGHERLIAWIKEDPANEFAFWTQMYIKLMPTQVRGYGPDGELTIKLTPEEMAAKLAERGLPPVMFGIDVPMLETP